MISLGTIQPLSILDLTSGVLAADGQVHGVSPASVGTGFSQAGDVLLDLAAQGVFELQTVEMGRQVE